MAWLEHSFFKLVILESFRSGNKNVLRLMRIVRDLEVEINLFTFNL
jgi:hypothetical protein